MTISVSNIQQVQNLNIKDILTDGQLKVGGNVYDVHYADNQFKLSHVEIKTNAVLDLFIDSMNAIYEGIEKYMYGNTERNAKVQIIASDLLEMKKAQVLDVTRELNEFAGYARAGLKDYTLQDHTEASFDTMYGVDEFKYELRILKEHADISDVNGLEPNTFREEYNQKLSRMLDDTKFCSRNLEGIEPCFIDPSKFLVTFDGFTLVMDNRDSRNGEFRGEFLKQQLSEGMYTNLRELIKSNYMTENDSLLICAANAIKNQMKSLTSGMPDDFKEEINAAVADIPVGYMRLADFM